VNAFVRHSTDFSELAGPCKTCPSIATIALVKQPEKWLWSTFRKLDAHTKESEQFSKREHDLADSRELDRYERKESRIENLLEDEKARSEQRNEQTRRKYLERQIIFAGSN
jgi:hypothetical protein